MCDQESPMKQVLLRVFAGLVGLGIALTGCGQSSGGGGGLPVYVDFPDTGACASGRTRCGAGCADLLSHPDHCGTCDTACAAGQLCVGGKCGAACPSDQTACDRLCVNTKTSAKNCGTCGHACAAGEVCSN